MKEKQIRDLTQGKISNQLFALAIPLMAMSFIQMAYNLVDLAWIGRLNSKIVAAVGTVGLLVWMLNSIALISKIGAEISIGQSIGAKHYKKASVYASHTTTIAAFLGIVFTFLFFTFPDTFISFYDLDWDISIVATKFLRVISLGIPFIFLILNFSGIYIGSGRSDIPFYFNAAGLVLNMILDPLAIFVFKWGAIGAAIATVFSQFIVLSLFIWHIRKYGILNNFPFFIKIENYFVKRIIYLGLPVAAMNVFFAFINMSLVKISFQYGGHLGVVSQTTGGQIEALTWNTSTGFATALGSFVAQNYAARQMDRVNKAFRTTLRIMMTYGIIISLLFINFGEQIFSIFVPEKDAYIAGGAYLFVLGVSQIFMILELTTEGMFNGLGRTKPPAIVSIVFNFMRIPLAYFFAEKMGITGVWWAITTSSIIKGTLLLLWYLRLQHKIKNTHITPL